MPFDPNNCALGADCKCAVAVASVDDNTEVMYWDCENWGRSSLPAPRIVHTDQHYGMIDKETVKRKGEELHKRQRKQERWLKESGDRLAETRRADPRAHLRKKGVKL